MKTLILSSIVLTMTATASMAGTPYVDHRENQQLHRIYNGIANGQLTFRESKSLLSSQARIYRAERRFKSDGVVTPAERWKLFLLQTREDIRIYNKKHN